MQKQRNNNKMSVRKIQLRKRKKIRSINSFQIKKNNKMKIAKNKYNLIYTKI